jgi:hypothetical protein
VDEPGLLYDKKCGTWLVDLTNVDEPTFWKRYLRGYMNRVRRTAGGVVAPPGGGCPAKPTAKPQPTGEPEGPDESPAPDEGGDPENAGRGGKPGKPDKPEKPEKPDKPKP